MKAVVWQGPGEIDLGEGGDAEEPHRQDEQLPASGDHPAAGRHGGRWRVRPGEGTDQTRPVDDVLEAYRIFDRREPGWVKVALAPVA